jgi:hypothetical protein
MIRRSVTAALSVLMFALVGMYALPAHASGGTSDMLAAVTNVSSEATKFRSMMGNLNASQIHVVNVQNAMSESQQNEYRKALHKNASDIADLRDTLNHTTVTGNDGVLITLRNLLKKQNITIDQINGVHIDSAGQITLFVQ